MLNDDSNPFKACKKLLSALHGELLAGHTLNNQVSYKRPRVSEEFVYALPESD